MYEITLQNRLQVGFALGFSVYRADDNFAYSEYIIFLGLISLHIKIE